MSVDASLQPSRVLSTRVYQSGPIAHLMKPEKISTTKQEEITTSRKKEELVTRQIETRVKREIVVGEDGQIIEMSDPRVSTHTTEDVKMDETETTKEKTHGYDPGPDWKLVPEATKVHQTVKKRSAVNTSVEERMDSEEVQELNGVSQAELDRVLAGRENLAIKATISHHQPLPDRPFLESEDVSKVAELHNGALTTHTTRTAHREHRADLTPPSSPPYRVTPTTHHVGPTTVLPVGVPRVDSPIRTDPLTRQTVNYDEDEEARHTETKRWIRDHFGNYTRRPSPELVQVKVVGGPAPPSPSPVSSTPPRQIPIADNGTSPKAFNAIKGYFQSAVENSANYYRQRADRTGSSGSGSASKSQQHISPTQSPTPPPGPEYANAPKERSHPNRDRPNLQRSHSTNVQPPHNNVEIRSNSHPTFARSNQQPTNQSAKECPDKRKQEMEITKIIDSLRSTHMREGGYSSNPSMPTYKSSSGNSSSPKDHVIKIQIQNGQEEINPKQFYFGEGNPQHPRLLGLVQKNSAINRSTPSLNQRLSPTSPPPIISSMNSSSRSHSSLALNSSSSSTLPRSEKRRDYGSPKIPGTSSVWISGSDNNHGNEVRRHQFMQGLLGSSSNGKSSSKSSSRVVPPSLSRPTSPPRNGTEQWNRSNKIRISNSNNTRWYNVDRPDSRSSR